MTPLYDNIGLTYDTTRKADPEIARRLRNHLQNRLSDVLSAKNVGAKCILVKTGRGLKSLAELSNNSSENLKVDYVADNVMTAVEWILMNLTMKSS